MTLQQLLAFGNSLFMSESSLNNLESCFDIPDDVTYLNAAYMGPLPKSALQAGIRAMKVKSQPWTSSEEDFYIPLESVRNRLARIGGFDSDQIALVPSVSYGLATAARNLNLSKGSQILLVEGQFPSNVYIWQKIAREKELEITWVKSKSGATITEALLEEISESTSLVATSTIHWGQARAIDLAKVSTKAKTVGSKLVIDATQGFGAWDLPWREIDADFVVGAGYKWLLGPYCSGFIACKPEYYSGEPIEESWANRIGSRDFSKLSEYPSEFEPGARRFDMGERSQHQTISVWDESLKCIEDWGVLNIEKKISELTDEIVKKAQALDLQPPLIRERAPHMTSIELPAGLQPNELSKKLAERQIYVSLRGNRLRIAPHVYNDKSHIDRLFVTIEDWLRRQKS